MPIHQYPLTKELKAKLYNSLNDHAVKTTGIIDGWDSEQIAFEAKDNDEFQGAVVAEKIFGQLHIKYLFVEEKYRKNGFGKQLMESALHYAKQQGCNFAFLETCSYQAPEFYKHLGFELEYENKGFQDGISLMLFKKRLTPF